MIFLFTQSSCLHDLLVYTIFLFTQSSCLHNLLVYTIFLFTRSSCLHDLLVYTLCLSLQAEHEVRFDFDGKVIPKGTVVHLDRGLHHHGLNPEEAGYTIEELFLLSRSAVRFLLSCC